MLSWRQAACTQSWFVRDPFGCKVHSAQGKMWSCSAAHEEGDVSVRLQKEGDRAVLTTLRLLVAPLELADAAVLCQLATNSAVPCQDPVRGPDSIDCLESAHRQ